MATASKDPIFQPPPPYSLTLRLNQFEAETLRLVVGSIAGDLDGPRAATDGIYRALVSAGVERPSDIIVSPNPSLSGPRYRG